MKKCEKYLVLKGLTQSSYCDTILLLAIMPVQQRGDKMFEYKTIIRGNANNVNPDTQFEVRAIVKAKSGGEAINHLMEWNMEEGGEPCYMARAYIWQKNKFNGTAIAKWDRINKPIETILERKLIDHADIKEMRCEG